MPNATTAAEVLICGAGPVGLACAYLLGNAGLDVLVIDAAQGIDTSPRAPFHHGPTAAALQTIGLLDDLRDAAFVHGHVGRHVPEFDYLRAIPFDGVMIGQDAICHALVRRLAKMPNVELQWNTELAALTQERASVSAVVHGEADIGTIACQWLIGADGARSAVRKLSHIAFEGHTWPDRVYAVNVRCDFAELGLADAQFRCDPSSWAVICRLDRHGNWRIAFGDDGAIPIEDELADATARLSDFIPQGMAFELLQIRPYRTHQRAASTMRLGRVILIGDAAHITAPWGGLGLTTGFWDAFILGDLLPEIVAGAVAEDALDAFSRERLKVYHQLTSPGATENRRVLQESDPLRRARDMAEFDALAGSAEMQQGFRAMSRGFVGNPILEKSRWLTGAA